MATTPAYASTPRNDRVVISTANTARDGTGTIADFVIAAATGTRVDDIYITASATTTAGMIRFFIHNGTDYKLLFEQAVTAVTPSGTVPAFSAQLVNLGIILKTGWKLAVSTNNAETFVISTTRSADF